MALQCFIGFNETMHHNDTFSIARRIQSFRCAFRGIALMVRSQHSAWLHALATVIVVSMGLWLQLERMEWCAVVLSIMAVWSAEALNTACEFLADVTSPDFHPLIEKAKDVAAGAVLIAALGSVIIAVLVMGPRLLSRF